MTVAALPKTILALDLGTQLGWAIGDIEAGTEVLKRTNQSDGMRYVNFRKWLREMLESGVDLVVYEDVKAHKGVTAAHIYGGLQALLMEECEARHIPYSGVGVGAIKKFATGKGNANKDLMIEAAKRKWPDFEGDDNQADARWLHCYAMVEWSNG
ncbi:MAG: hypothetical protein KGL39_47700 [Patescibacteria group bacterium]|nr:hypothetical protein [Patescibacteria group bacterium]